MMRARFNTDAISVVRHLLGSETRECRKDRR